MTNTPEPLDEPVDVADSEAAGQAPASGSPAEADSDIGYSRGDEGESDEAVNPERRSDSYLDTDVLRGGPGDSRG